MTDGRACDDCELFFSEFDLELRDGKWLCRKCEDIIGQIDIQEVVENDQ